MRTDRQTCISKLIVAFRSFMKEHKQIGIISLHYVASYLPKDLELRHPRCVVE